MRPTEILPDHSYRATVGRRAYDVESIVASGVVTKVLYTVRSRDKFNGKQCEARIDDFARRVCSAIPIEQSAAS
jgi:hypothetical protein